MLNKKGFTLIELVVVMAIIAILFAAVLIAADPASKFAEARNTQRRNDLRIILTAIYQYYSDNNQTYPGGITSISSTPTLISNSGYDWCQSGSGGLLQYMSNGMPHDPNASNGTWSSSSCGATYDTLYKVSQSSGKITMTATATELSATITLTD